MRKCNAINDALSNALLVRTKQYSESESYAFKLLSFKHLHIDTCTPLGVVLQLLISTGSRGDS